MDCNILLWHCKNCLRGEVQSSLLWVFFFIFLFPPLWIDPPPPSLFKPFNFPLRIQQQYDIKSVILEIWVYRKQNKTKQTKQRKKQTNEQTNKTWKHIKVGTVKFKMKICMLKWGQMDTDPAKDLLMPDTDISVNTSCTCLASLAYRWCRDFCGSNHTRDTPVATSPGARRNMISSGTGCDWGRWKVWSATFISVWQHVKLSGQIRPAWHTLACCRDDKQATNINNKKAWLLLHNTCYIKIAKAVCYFKQRHLWKKTPTNKQTPS